MIKEIIKWNFRSVKYSNILAFILYILDWANILSLNGGFSTLSPSVNYLFFFFFESQSTNGMYKYTQKIYKIYSSSLFIQSLFMSFLFIFIVIKRNFVGFAAKTKYYYWFYLFFIFILFTVSSLFHFNWKRVCWLKVINWLFMFFVMFAARLWSSYSLERGCRNSISFMHALPWCHWSVSRNGWR